MNAEFDPLHLKRALIVVAHPDDPEFPAGGTIARWVQNGARVVYVIVTDGGKGSGDPEITSDTLIGVRKAEQLAAARVLGVHEVVFLDYPDGGVYNTPELRRDLTRQIRLHRPDVLVTHDPTARILRDEWINHPDHLAVGDAALNAVFPLARDRLNYPEHEAEGLAPHKTFEVLLISTDQTNYCVDVGDTLELKIAALQEHRSQVEDPDELADRIRRRAAESAAGASFRYGECFRRISLRR